MKDKIKGFLHSAEAKIAAAGSTAACALTVAASAEDTTAATTAATITTAFQTGFQSMASDAMSMIAIIIPIGLGVAGAVFLSRKAIGWFKSLAK